jgi:hypothetical protein
MNLRLVRAIARAENADDLHLARLLILLQAVDQGKGETVEGIVKLAKLDFLLRYPNCLERALRARRIDPATAGIRDYERETIETKMTRFRYGPWDDRYRRWIGLLVAKGLVMTYVKGRTVHIELQERGREVAAQLSEREEFADLSLRSRLVVKAVGGLSATKLMEFIYEIFPEITDMKWGEQISL